MPIVSEGVTYFYAVNVRNEQGWALVSNEERYVPVVAYSLRGNIDVNDSDSLWYRFLKEHIDAIDSIRAYNVTTPRISIKRQRIMSGTPSQGTANRVVLPIIGNLEWRQGIIDSNHCEKSYNRYCPEKENNPKYCDRAPVGCTGVAMAMIMRCWNWPDYTEDNNMEKHYLDWGAIPDVIYSYTPTHEAHMLAHLLYDCGVAANSHYRKNYTWATIEAARGGFKDKLGYTEAGKVFGGMWGVFDWLSNPIKEEIDAGRPVFCQGWQKALDPSDSHSFVIYGYEEKDGEFKFCANMGHGFSESAVWCTLDTIIGYNKERSILTGLQPNCASRATQPLIVDSIVVNNGELHTEYSTSSVVYGIAHQVLVKNGGRLIVKASERIVLLPGFRAEYGSSATLSIKPFCDVAGSYVRKSAIHNIDSNDVLMDDSETVEKGTILYHGNLHVSPNPVKDIMSVYINEELSCVLLYNLNGQCVLQTNQTDIDVSSLPQGMYILRAITSTGDLKQAKFIKE